MSDGPTDGLAASESANAGVDEEVLNVAESLFDIDRSPPKDSGLNPRSDEDSPDHDLELGPN